MRHRHLRSQIGKRVATRRGVTKQSIKPLPSALAVNYSILMQGFPGRPSVGYIIEFIKDKTATAQVLVAKAFMVANWKLLSDSLCRGMNSFPILTLSSRSARLCLK